MLPPELLPTVVEDFDVEYTEGDDDDDDYSNLVSARGCCYVGI